MLKERTSLVLDSVINEINNTENIDKIDDTLFSMSKPKIFNGMKSIEVTYNKQFESACILISKTLNIDAKSITTFAYYSALEQIKLQSQNNKHKQR